MDTILRPARNRTPGIKSLQDTAYQAIKYRIITCALMPGEYINEASLTALLRIGRTPVHQALARLQLEGLVEVIPRKGVIVKPVSLQDVMQIIEARQLIEPHIVRLASKRADESEIALMHDILARADEIIMTRKTEQLMLLDRDFHLAIAQAAKSTLLADILGNLHDCSLRFWFISLNAPDHHRSVQDEHRAIFATIQARDADAAELAIRAHIDSFRRNVANCL